MSWILIMFIANGVLLIGGAIAGALILGAANRAYMRGLGR